MSAKSHYGMIGFSATVLLVCAVIGIASFVLTENIGAIIIWIWIGIGLAVIYNLSRIASALEQMA